MFEENLRPFCESVAEFSGYGFDDSDWQAIENALARRSKRRCTSSPCTGSADPAAALTAGF
jgi:hypothetical protein